MDQDEVLFDWDWEREMARLEEWEDISEILNSPEDHERVVKLAEERSYALIWLTF